MQHFGRIGKAAAGNYRVEYAPLLQGNVTALITRPEYLGLTFRPRMNLELSSP
jgi:hypothetical protein